MEVDDSSVSTFSGVEFSSTFTGDKNHDENDAFQNVDKHLQSDAVCKFMNGEISFNEYLNQMKQVDETEESQNSEINVPIESTDKINAASMNEKIEYYELGTSDISFSENESDEQDDTKYKSTRRGKKRKRKGIQRSKLSPTLKAVMGQANVCYAKGETEMAVKMCLEIIKEEPNASEPFKTLASIYEEMGEQEKSLQMRLIAAHLGPSSKDEWIELAEILKKKNQIRQALVCYTKAINFDELNLSLYEERAALMKENGAVATEAYGYLRLLYKLDAEKDGQTLLYLCKKVAKLYYNEKKFGKSCNTLKYAFEKCPNLVTNEEVNLYLDVLITTKNYEECLNILTNFCSIEFKTNISDCVTVIEECIVPEDLSIDIRAKLIITLIQFNSIDCAEVQINILLDENPDLVGDLFFDVGMVLMDKERYEEAIKLLDPLTGTKLFNSITLWFKLAHCYKNLNKIQECHHSYKKALEYFPDNNDIKLKYCRELKSANLYKEAVEITLLENSPSLLIHERCKLYLILNEMDNFIEAGWQLFRLHCKEIKTCEDYRLFLNVLHLSKGFRDVLSPHVNSSYDESVTLAEEYEIFVKICNLYIERKDYDLLQQLTMSLYLSLKFLPYKKTLRIAITFACLFNNDYELGFDMIRYLILKQKINSQRIWNVFNVITLHAEYSRLHKFLTRHLFRNPTDDNILMLYANNCLLAGTYKYALNDHTLLYEKLETPLLTLLIALDLLHVSCQKFSTNKHALVSQVVVFLKKYEHLRGSAANQEIFYNIGRAFHQLELLPEALFYYKKALCCNPPIKTFMFDLKFDIVYNLHLIYLNSGQPDIANMYLQKYIVI